MRLKVKGDMTFGKGVNVTMGINKTRQNRFAFTIDCGGLHSIHFFKASFVVAERIFPFLMRTPSAFG